MTGVYNAQAEEALRQPIRHVVEARLTGSFGTMPLDVIGGRVEFTARNHPQAAATMQIKIPDTQELIERFDPRVRPRLDIDAGYVYSSGVRDVKPLARLDVYQAIVSRPEDTMTLRAVGKEIRLQDTISTSNTPVSFNSTSDGPTAIRALIGMTDNDIVAVNVNPSTFVTGADIKAFNMYDNAGDFIQDIADRIGAWVYHDGIDTWRIDPLPTVAGKTAHFLSVGTAGQIRTVESERTRTDFYNSVSVSYKWYDGTQREANGFAEVGSGPYSVYAVGRKHYKDVREFQGSSDMAAQAAKTMLTRGITRGRTLSIGSAAAAYWLRPGMTIQTQLSTGPAERHIVDSVLFDLPEGTMHITTRQPENADITIGI